MLRLPDSSEVFVRRFTTWLAVLTSMTLAGCPRQDLPFDAGPERDAGAGPLDAGSGEVDAGPDAPDAGGPEVDGGGPGVDGGGGGTDAGSGTDAGVLPPGGSTAAPAAEIVRTGTGGVLLRGTVLAPGGPISPGEVLIVGDTIRCVAASCASDPMASGVTIIDTHGTISPGLIDGHNHATYDFLPEWVPDPLRIFGSRYDWRSDPMYREHVRPESQGGTSSSFICPATKWAELRSIVHGTTTMQGQSPNQACVNRLVRNADHSHGLGPDRMQTTISGPCETALSDTARATLVSNFASGSTTRYAIHMAEGTTGTTMTTNVLREYECYAGSFRATTSLLADASGTPYGTGLFIHAVALTDAQLTEAAAMRVHFVWSPSSNILLYGATAPIGRMIELGLSIGLGPDWTVSGSDEMLSEMRFALDWAQTEREAAVTPERVWRMATLDGADAVGLGASTGRLEAGYRADVAVFGRVGRDPYQAVADSRAADVRLVMIDGAAYYGDLALEGVTAVNGDCEPLDACGASKFLCAANTPGSTGATARADETVESIRGQLRAHLAAGYTDSAGAMRAYVVGPDQLLDLVDCSL